jgi:hypothetical protein
MAKLTEDETVRLLKETFADREQLVDAGLPEATTTRSAPRRRSWPVLAAAASVLAVAAGSLYVAQGGDRPEVEPPIATTTTTSPGTGSSSQVPPVAARDAAIWAAAIKEIATVDAPAGGWPGLIVLDAPVDGMLSTKGPGHEVRGKPFSATVRRDIETLLADVAPVEWVPKRPDLQLGEGLCARPPLNRPIITVGPIAEKPNGRVTVVAYSWRDCGQGNWKAFDLVKQGAAWRVTGWAAEATT